MRTLSFDKELQVYTVDGEVVPRVTNIVDVVTGKDLSSIPQAALAAARERGTKIHEDIESGNPQTVEGQWILTQLRGPVKNEVSNYGIVDGLLFAGTTDLLYEDGSGIDDVKTQATKDILAWTIQLNLYRKIFGGDTLRVLHCPKTGNFHVVPIATLPDVKMNEIIEAYRSNRILPKDFLLAESKQPEPASLELVVYKNTVGELTTNAKVILATVKKNLANYKAENYSESNIADAKRDKAELNSAAKKLNDKRLELEREFMKPFNEFKDTVTETCTEIKKASSQIDAVVKEVEEREKAEKQEQIEKFFAAKGCKLFALNQIWNSAWLNKTSKIKDIQAEIIAKIDKVEQDLIILDRIGEPDAKAHYLTTLDLDSALRCADEIKANREKMAAFEKERQEREAAKKAEEPAPIAAPEPELTPEPEPMPEPVRSFGSGISFSTRQTPPPAPEMLERTMWVRGTYEQIVALGDFMNANGIEFRKL